MRAAGVVDAEAEFRTVACPTDAAHRLSVIVLDRHAQVHLPLTLFANRTRQQLSVGSARAYLAALRPFMSAVERNRRSVEAEIGWGIAPPPLPRLFAHYL